MFGDAMATRETRLSSEMILFLKVYYKTIGRKDDKDKGKVIINS